MKILLALTMLLGIYACSRVSRDKPVHANDKQWRQMHSTAALISNNHSGALEAVHFARNDKSLLTENSAFLTQAKIEFGNNLVEWLVDDLTLEQSVAAVFKTVLHGYGFMGYIDHKQIYHPTTLLDELAKVLATNGVVVEDLESVAVDWQKTAAIADPQQQANALVEAMSALATLHGFSLLWFDEGGDSYAFFTVPASVADQLNGVVVDSDHKFTAPPHF